MSTPQTDSTFDRQERYYIEFDGFVNQFLEGAKDYDEVVEELQRLCDDEDVSFDTWEQCRKLWKETVSELKELAQDEYITNKNKHV